MLVTREVSTDAETERCNQLTSGFLILAEKELSAFIGAVHTLFGSRRAKRRWTGSRNSDAWIGRLGNRFQIGVGLRWEQVLGLALARIYWKGSAYERTRRQIAPLLSQGELDVGPGSRVRTSNDRRGICRFEIQYSSKGEHHDPNQC